MDKQTETDVLIIGSGPIGATFARIINDALPEAKILMIDAGPRLTGKAGMHIKNIADETERANAQIRSQGTNQKQYKLITASERANAANIGELSLDLLARPGTHLLSEDVAGLKKNEMPAAAHSTNAGGMGSHWTCACPRPGNAERIPFIPADEYEYAFSKAEELLYVTQKAFPASAEALAIQKLLGSVLNQQLAQDRQVQPMPLACKTNDKGERYWLGPDLILGKLAEPDYKGNFELRTETICRQLFTKAGTVTGALTEHLLTKTTQEIKAKIIVVAADVFRTPQLLWASGIRLKALGRYLNEHPFIFCFVELHDELIDRSLVKDQEQWKMAGPIGAFWVPFDAPHHPFHGQVMSMDESPLKIETYGNPKPIVGLGWGCTKEVRYEDHVYFSEDEKDSFGMPKMNIHFKLTERDHEQIEKAKQVQSRAAAAFGRVFKECEQTLMPPGTSLHAQGTVRMGTSDNGESVCDSYSNVWGYSNLFVGGNGVIPMATTSNPTLTSVAMAARAGIKIIEKLKIFG